MRISFAPYALSGKGLAPPTIRPEGLEQSLGVLRTLFRMVKDASRVEMPFFRVFDARYGYLMKYNMPAPKGPTTLADTSKPAPKREPSGELKKTPQVGKKPDRPAGGSHPRNRSPRR